jgi:hypothetical protein
MKKITFTLIILSAFLVTKVNAQMQFGVKAGLNLATMSIKAAGEKVDDIKMNVGFHVGGIVDIPFMETMSFQPGLLFSVKGYKIDNDAMKSTGTPLFIEIPLNVVYKIPFGENKILINAGPYLGYGIAGKSKVGDEKDNIKWGNKDDSDSKPLDFGLNIGAGAQIKNILVNLNYGFGFANLTPKGDSDNKSSNRVIGISVGYLFGGK